MLPRSDGRDEDTLLAAEREIAKSIVARSPANASSHGQDPLSHPQVASRAAAPAGAGVSTAAGPGQEESTLDGEGDLNLDDDFSAMDIEALLAVRADGNM